MQESRNMSNQSDQRIVEILEQLRQQYNLSIEKFTDGIVSARNYSRYLNGEVKMNFSVLSRLLERLSISISDFSYYVHNGIILEYGYEIDFFNQLVRGNTELAYQVYVDKIKDCALHTYLSKSAIPCAIIYLEYKRNNASLMVAKNEMRNYVNLKMTLKKKYLVDDDFGALYFYSKVASKEEQELILRAFLNHELNPRYRNFSLQIEESEYIKYLMLIELVLTLDSTDNDVRLIISKALDFDRRARLGIYHYLIFRHLYQYKLDNQMPLNNDLIIFYYIMALISIHSNEELYEKSIEIRKSDMNRFKEMIKSKVVYNMNMYEGLIDDAYL